LSLVRCTVVARVHLGGQLRSRRRSSGHIFPFAPAGTVLLGRSPTGQAQLEPFSAKHAAGESKGNAAWYSLPRGGIEEATGQFFVGAGLNWMIC
jgi:hypothetical protein